MAKSYQVTVRYNPIDGSLKIEPAARQDLTLAPDTSPIHSVRWSFAGAEGLVAAGWMPGIRFVFGPNNTVPQYPGPFMNLTCATSEVIASGNSGESGTYRYHAMLQPPIASGLQAIRSSEARLFNQVMEPIPAVIRVAFPTGGRGLLQVEPEVVTCTRGQAILWEVFDAPRDLDPWFPRLVFQDGPEGMNSRLGPFTSLDTRADGLLASGSAGRSGQYKYVFQIVNIEDNSVRFKSSPDPTIDDEGDPPGDGGDD